MKIWTQYTAPQIHDTLLEETAKATAELRTARADLEKANNRLSFCLTAINELKNRDQEQQI